MAKLFTLQLVASGAHQKIRQWKAFRTEREGGNFPPGRPVADELRAIHRVFANEVFDDLTDPAKAGRFLQDVMVFLDRPVSDRQKAAMTSVLTSLFDSSGIRPGCPEWDAVAFLEKAAAAFAALFLDTRVEFDPKIPGELRAYGQRSIENGPWGRAYGSNLHVRDPMLHVEQSVGLVGAAYYGLTTGLEQRYAQLCQRYEELRGNARNTDQRLEAMMFLQLIGGRLLRPFWDANARTFMAHTVLELQREGLPVERWEEIHELGERMRRFQSGVLGTMLQESGLRWVERHSSMILDPDFRADYMQRLSDALGKAIQQGTDGLYEEMIHEAAKMVKFLLVRERILILAGSRGLEGSDAERFHWQFEPKAGCVRSVPIPGAEHLLDLFLEWFVHDRPAAQALEQMVGRLQSAGVPDSTIIGLARLMEKYEQDGIAPGIAPVIVECVDAAVEIGQRTGRPGRVEPLMKAMGDERIHKVVALWPEKGRAALMRAAWSAAIGREENDLPKFDVTAVAAIAHGLDNAALREWIGAREGMEQELYSERIAKIVGYSASPTQGEPTLRAVSRYPQAAGELLHMLAEVAEFTQDADAVKNARRLFLAVATENEEGEAAKFCQRIRAEIKHGKTDPDRQRAVRELSGVLIAAAAGKMEE